MDSTSKDGTPPSQGDEWGSNGGWNDGGEQPAPSRPSDQGGWNVDDGTAWPASPVATAAPAAPAAPATPPPATPPVSTPDAAPHGAPPAPWQPGTPLPGGPPGAPPGAPGQYGYGPPGGAIPPQTPTRRSRGPLIAGLVVLLVVLAGGAVFAWQFVQGSGDQLATRVPSGATVYAHLNLNPSAGNKLGIQALIDRVNDAAGEDIVSIQALVEELESGEDTPSFADDIDPWLGDQVAVYLGEIPPVDDMAAGTPEDFAILLAVDDADAAAAFIDDQNPLGEYDAGDGRQGWLVAEGTDGGPDGVAVIDGGVLFLGTELAVENALDAESSLAEDEGYATVTELLPDRVVTVFVDTPTLVEAAAAGAEEQELLQSVGPTAVAVSFADGSVDISGVVALEEGTSALTAEPVAATDLADLPAGGLFYGRFPDLGPLLTSALESADAGASMAAEELGEPLTDDQLPSVQIESGLENTLGTSVSEIAGWLGDLSLAIAYDPSATSDNAGLLVQAAVADVGAATDLVDAIAEQLPPEILVDVDSGSITAGDLSLQVVDEALRLQAGSLADGTLGEDAAYQAAVDGLVGDPLVYIDVPAVVRAIAPFAVGIEPTAEAQQAVDVAAAFDAVVAGYAVEGGVVRSTLRISYGSELEAVEIGEPNLPALDFGDLGTFEDIVDGASGGDDAQPIGGEAGVATGTDPVAGEPFTFGDDPDLDVLYASCASGDFVACDDLYFASPIGSEYEEFAVTCGGRSDQPTVSCVEQFG